MPTSRDFPTPSAAALSETDIVRAPPTSSRVDEPSTVASSALGVIQIRTGRTSAAKFGPHCASPSVTAGSVLPARRLSYGKGGRAGVSECIPVHGAGAVAGDATCDAACRGATPEQVRMGPWSGLHYDGPQRADCAYGPASVVRLTSSQPRQVDQENLSQNGSDPKVAAALELEAAAPSMPPSSCVSNLAPKELPASPIAWAAARAPRRRQPPSRQLPQISPRHRAHQAVHLPPLRRRLLRRRKRSLHPVHLAMKRPRSAPHPQAAPSRGPHHRRPSCSAEPKIESTVFFSTAGHNSYVRSTHHTADV